MSKTRTKKIRKEFEKEYGFTVLQRKTDVYKSYWRRFKKARYSL